MEEYKVKELNSIHWLHTNKARPTAKYIFTGWLPDTYSNQHVGDFYITSQLSQDIV